MVSTLPTKALSGTFSQCRYQEQNILHYHCPCTTDVPHHFQTLDKIQVKRVNYINKAQLWVWDFICLDHNETKQVITRWRLTCSCFFVNDKHLSCICHIYPNISYFLDTDTNPKMRFSYVIKQWFGNSFNINKNKHQTNEFGPELPKDTQLTKELHEYLFRTIAQMDVLVHQLWYTQLI